MIRVAFLGMMVHSALTPRHDKPEPDDSRPLLTFHVYHFAGRHSLLDEKRL